jgi:hypothetical protein
MSICLITAAALLALVAVPALACNGTVGKAFKVKSDVDYWEDCYYVDPQVTGNTVPVGPAYHFGQEVIIHYVGEQLFTATDRLDRNRKHKVTWTRNVDGTATIYAPYGTGTFAAMAMRATPQLTVQAPAQDHAGTIFPLTCYPMDPPNPLPTPADVLYNGPFVVQEVVKDIGNDSGCFDANNPAPTSFTDCLMSNADGPWQLGLWENIEYLNYHAKITGRQHVYNWTMEIREPGKICYEDRNGFDACYLFGQE